MLLRQPQPVGKMLARMPHLKLKKADGGAMGQPKAPH
jgi:hypothetical protein